MGIAIAIAIVLICRKISVTRNEALLSRIDSHRRRASDAQRTAVRVIDVAEKAVNEALIIREVNAKVDELLELERAGREAKPGRHALRVVSDGQQGFVA